jgi:hypothetical protein
VVDVTGAPRNSRVRRTGCYLWFYQALAAALVLVDPFHAPDWPNAVSPSAASFAGSALGVRPARAGELPPASRNVEAEHARIAAQPLCVVSKEASFGALGEVVLYVYSRQGDELSVGYFVYWTVERPWGANLPTYTLLPSLAIDGAYTHFLFLLPGIQRALYGAGDVEGATVVYDVGGDGRLRVKAAYADDALHDGVVLAPRDVATRDGRVALMTDVWSHQLGAVGAASHYERGDADVSCFAGATLKPLTPDTARAFRLGSFASPLRARPAWRAAAAR